MRNNFFLYYLLLVIAQLMVCNFLHVTPLLTLSVLPVLVLCIPTRFGTLPTMFLAFLTGLLVDLFADCSIGLNVFALVPVALIKRNLCTFIFGEEMTVREEEFSIRKYGPAKVIFAIFVVQTVFLLIYIWADGGSSRTMAFNAMRFAVSLVSCILVSIPLVSLLKPDERK